MKWKGWKKLMIQKIEKSNNYKWDTKESKHNLRNKFPKDLTSKTWKGLSKSIKADLGFFLKKSQG